MYLLTPRRHATYSKKLVLALFEQLLWPVCRLSELEVARCLYRLSAVSLLPAIDDEFQYFSLLMQSAHQSTNVSARPDDDVAKLCLHK